RPLTATSPRYRASTRSPTASRVSAVMRGVVPRSLFTPSSRAVTFTVSPITVYFTRPVPPPLPTKTTPTWIPVPTRSSATPRVVRGWGGGVDTEGGGGRPPRVGSVGKRGSEDGEDPVADEVVDHATLREDRVDHRREVLVQVGSHLLCRHGLRQRGEATKVRHQ